MTGIEKEIADFCLQYNMLPPGSTVLACVSGGTDSMFLLEVLRRLAPGLGFNLCAAHYNHRLRGAESDGDEAFVRDRCEGLGIPLCVGSGDVAGEALRRGLGTEETARDMRYAFFRKTAVALSGARIATAHTSDDNLETVLMRIARGTGLRGLCGIPPVNGEIVRPILCISRARIEAYNREHGIPHREDSTNALDDYTRNLIRHRAVPALRQVNPAVNVTEMTELLRRDNEYLEGEAEKYLEKHLHGGALEIAPLASLPLPVASRVIRAFAGPGLASGHVDAALELCRSGGPSARLSLPGVTLRREYGRLYLGEPQPVTFAPRPLTVGTRVRIDEAGLAVTVSPWVSGQIYKSLTNFIIKEDTIISELYVRPRRPGDTLRTAAGTKSLKKLMIERHIPAHLRDGLPVIVSGDRVLAVMLIGQSADTLPAKGEPALRIEIEKEGK